MLLVYSALVIPFQLSFWVEDDVCNPSPTLYCDVLVDTIFLVNMIEIMVLGFVYTSGCKNWLFQLDVAVNFFIGYYHEGLYHDRLEQVYFFFKFKQEDIFWPLVHTL